MDPVLLSPPTSIEYKGMRFLILDAPSDQNAQKYADFMQKKGVTVLVRTCEPTYNTAPLTRAGIRVVESPFPDGEAPPDTVVDNWLDIVHKEFGMDDDKKAKPKKEEKKRDEKKEGENTNCVAVHCVAGLGRAPVLVAIALIEAGMEPLSAIAFIRKKRRGAINAKQIRYLEKYKPRRKDKPSCLVM